MEAEEQHNKAIKIWEGTLGLEAVEVAAGLIKLAGLLKRKVRASISHGGSL